MMITGIYTITNSKNGRRYVGSAVNVHQRWQAHRFRLRNGIHENSYLQRSWKKHGEEVFVFECVQEVQDPTDLLRFEQEWIDRLWNEGLYNRRRVAANNLGVRHTEEAKARMSVAQKARAKNPTPGMLEGRKKIGLANTGRTASDETKAKMSAAQLGREVSQEFIEKMRVAAANRSEEHLAKIGEAKAGDFIVTIPDGEEIFVRNLTAFARAHGLTQSLLCKVSKGERKQHKGYRVRPADSEGSSRTSRFPSEAV